MRITFSTLMLACGLIVSAVSNACETPASVCTTNKPGSFALIHSGQAATVYVDASADSAVQRAATNFAADIQRVGGEVAQRITNVNEARGELVIIGVIG